MTPAVHAVTFHAVHAVTYHAVHVWPTSNLSCLYIRLIGVYLRATQSPNTGNFVALKKIAQPLIPKY